MNISKEELDSSLKKALEAVVNSTRFYESFDWKTMEEGERPAADQSCLVVNEKWGKDPIMAYWEEEMGAFIPLYCPFAFPLLVSHWLELPQYDSGK